MNRLIILLAVIAVAAVTFATESEPSITVGFVTIEVSDDPGTVNHITIQPRGTETDGDFTEIWGTQFIGGVSPADVPDASDLLEEYVAGAWLNKWRNPGGTWIGSITGIDHYKSYFFYNRHGAGNVTKVFAGDVIPAGTVVNMGMIASTTIPGVPVRTFVANPLPMQRMLSGVQGDCYNLLGSGLHPVYPSRPGGDAIEHYTGTVWLNAFYLGGHWVGSLSSLVPGKGYEIVDMSAGPDWNWTFIVGTDVLTDEQADSTGKASSHK
ncbi:MAG: hypothetical protein ISR91_07850 [Candidatus Delongbacteria bacterium]|nr:hypothetical protein [Candidatus Delongbacteria bacterium]